MKFTGEPDDQMQADIPQSKSGSGRRTAVLLLIIGAAAAYLYFFTDLIRDHHVQQKIPAVASPRKPLPRREAVMRPATSANRSVQTGTASVHPEGKPIVAAQAAATAPVKAEQKKTAGTGLTTAETAQKNGTASAVQTKSPCNVRGNYAVQCGPFVTAAGLASARSALKKSGIVSVVVSSGPKRPTLMHRLFVAGYSDAAMAMTQRDQLLKVSSDAFVLPNNGNYELFAGSYYDERRALKMQHRLTALGIRAEIRQVTLPVATKLLTAREYGSRVSAEQTVRLLQDKGIDCRVVRRGK